MAYINKTKEFVFIGNARCASTSMYEKLARIFDNTNIINDGLGCPPSKYHMGVKEVLENYPFTENYYKFCFVRNPWSRVFSAYKEFKKTHHRSWSYPILEYKSFEEFCLDFNNCSLARDIHFLPNYEQITIDQKICVDFVGKFENIYQDFEKVLGILGKGKITLDVHSRRTISSDYRKMYNNQTKNTHLPIYPTQEGVGGTVSFVFLSVPDSI